MLDKKFKIYLYFCIFIFLFLLGIILFYSFGYKYNIEENKTIQTGAIIIKTYPKEVATYKNDLLHKDNRTIVDLFNDFVKIDNLKIGKYNIKIKKDEYFDWEKNVDVESGRVTELKNIVLLKKNYNLNIILNKMEINSDKNSIWVNDKNSKIAYKKESEKGLFLATFSPSETEEKIIVDFQKSPFVQMKKGFELDEVIFSEDDTKLILKIITEKQVFWYLVESENRIYNLTSVLAEIGEFKNKWNFFFGESLFYVKNNTLYKFDYAKKSSEKTKKDVSSFLIKDSNIYFFNFNDNGLYFDNMNNLSDARKIFEMPEDFNSELLTKITKTHKNSYLILSSSGKLYFINNSNKINFINSSVQKADFSNGNERIIYGNNHEIWTYYIKEKTSQPTKKEFTNELITRFSGNISNIFLYKDEEHLFYKEGEVFKFLELDGRDRRNVFEIMKIDNDNIFYSRDFNSLYYVKNSRLIRVDLDEE